MRKSFYFFKYLFAMLFVLIIVLAIGFVIGFKFNIKLQEKINVRYDSPRVDRENTAIGTRMSDKEIAELREKVKNDEKEYGDNYRKPEGLENILRNSPDRIYYKSGDVEGFYIFDSSEDTFKHVLEVIEDRMSYTIIDDFNLYSFKPLSMEDIFVSKDNYVIYEYDNENIDKADENYNENIIFKFNYNNRLSRLLKSLAYDKKLVLVEDLNCEEFFDDTNISGYKYMHQNDLRD